MIKKTPLIVGFGIDESVKIKTSESINACVMNIQLKKRVEDRKTGALSNGENHDSCKLVVSICGYQAIHY